MEEKSQTQTVQTILKDKTDADVIIYLFQEYKLEVQNKDYWKEYAQELSGMLKAVRTLIEKEQIRKAKLSFTELEQIKSPLIDSEDLKPILGMPDLCEEAKQILQEREHEFNRLPEDDKEGSTE